MREVYICTRVHTHTHVEIGTQTIKPKGNAFRLIRKYEYYDLGINFLGSINEAIETL